MVIKWLRSPRSYPILVVVSSAVVAFVIIASGEPIPMTFPLLLFISAKMCVLFATVEFGLSLVGIYKDKDKIYQAVSRAITALGMAVCFILLLGAFESALLGGR